MQRRITVAVVTIAALLSGCASCPPPIEKPTVIPVPPQCLAECPYDGPAAIKTNGELLLAYRSRLEQAQCLEARQQCVRDLNAQP